MKKTYFVLLFFVTFLEILASAETSVDVSTTLQLIDSSEITCVNRMDVNKDTRFEILGSDINNVTIYIKEAEENKIKLKDSEGKETFVDLRSEITYKNDKINGDFTLVDAEKDLQGTMTIRMLYN